MEVREKEMKEKLTKRGGKVRVKGGKYQASGKRGRVREEQGRGREILMEERERAERKVNEEEG